ncbi:PREDICTED: uncharacterized protein LOC105147237 [Acromyrmex echinatior]|uniref:uncharacterized protein LOC105147237 n=1 Tax=Acromyrmex echinatior TaxID=103372 RepID=UPI000580E093|nr:PREDICTED: uncharacterized protein LOC105147237 [Acromyrmex echinatior]
MWNAGCRMQQWDGAASSMESMALNKGLSKVNSSYSKSICMKKGCRDSRWYHPRTTERIHERRYNGSCTEYRWPRENNKLRDDFRFSVPKRPFHGSRDARLGIVG